MSEVCPDKELASVTALGRAGRGEGQGRASLDVIWHRVIWAVGASAADLGLKQVLSGVSLRSRWDFSVEDVLGLSCQSW